MSRRVPTVAIVGRTNVGKSTLFNALSRKRAAIVEDVAGVTRDRHARIVNHLGPPFTLVDTGGLVGEDDAETPPEIARTVKEQTELAIKEADVVLAVFDGIAGVHALDAEVVDFLRRSERKVLWIVNKCEKPVTATLSADFYSLGVDDLFCVSAAHQIGIRELAKRVQEALGRADRENESLDNESLDNGDQEVQQQEKLIDQRIRVSVMGRPNAGKSSLINRILGEERLITSPLAGTTRDAVDIELTRDGRRFVIVDTAGLRKKAKVSSETVERYANLRTLRSLAASDVVVLVIDATRGTPSDQDQKIAELVHGRGKGLVIVVNKWDAVEKDHRSVQEFKEIISKKFSFARYAPVLFVSALSGRRCPSVLETVTSVYESSRERVRTADLNRVLQSLFLHRPPPVARGAPVKLYFATQTEVAPPTIVLFLNYPKELKPSYQRYLKEHLRKHFPFPGIDIRLVLRKRTEKAQQRLEKKES